MELIPVPVIMQVIEDLRNSKKVEPFPGMNKRQINYLKRKLVKAEMIR